LNNASLFLCPIEISNHPAGDYEARQKIKEDAMNEQVQQFLEQARRGDKQDVDSLMDHLKPDSDFSTLKIVDFALGHVDSPEGKERINDYLHRGSKMQRNYCVNYFRRNELRNKILRAWEEGRIDHIQAFAR